MDQLKEVQQQVSALLSFRSSMDYHGSELEAWWPSSLSAAAATAAATTTNDVKIQDLCNAVSGIHCRPFSKFFSSVEYQVVSLDWTSQDLSGTIPTEIGYLTYLERLALGNNEFHGTLPTSIQQLTMLEHLELYRNNFFGPLPGTIWSNMTHLKRLLLQSNDFSGTLSDDLCSLISMHSLDIFDNPLTGTLPHCMGSSLLELESIQMYDTQLTGSIPSGLCQRTKMNDMESSNETGVGCNAAACPVFSYQPVYGRQSSEISCLPCPTALYLGSTTCPDNVPRPFPDDSSSFPSMVNNLTTAPTFRPTIGPSQDPSDSFSTSHFPTDKIPSLLPSLPAGMINTSIPIEDETLVIDDDLLLDLLEDNSTGTPTVAPTLGVETTPTVTSTTFVETFSPTETAWDIQIPFIPNNDNLQNGELPSKTEPSPEPSSSTTNWTLLATACLLSALAMLTVVLARRSGHQWWLVKKRREEEAQEEQTQQQERRHRRSGDDEDPIPASFHSSRHDMSVLSTPSKMTTTASLHRRRHSGHGESQSHGSSSSRRNNMTSRSLSPWHGRSLLRYTSLPDEERREKKNSNDMEDEDSSLESESGWNDTVSSIDDSSTSSSSSSSSSSLPHDHHRTGAFPTLSCTNLSSRPAATAYFPNDIVPV